MDEVKEKLTYICSKFRIEGDILVYRWIPAGHINTAYYAAVYNGKEIYQLLIQRVNTYVFRDPVGMMHNIELLTEHVRSKEPTMEKRRRLHFRHTAARNNYIVLKDGVAMGPDEPFDPLDESIEFWRVYNFIEYSTSFETAEGNPEVLRMSGKAFGKFLRQLEDFEAGQLIESIPHFHDTRYRLDNFFSVVEKDELGRAASCREEIGLIEQYRDFGCTLCRQIDRGELPLRVTHNDTKTNNILFDKDNLDPLVIIDLDTCMPGLACYDFGDTIRFAACTAEEDQPDGMQLDLRLMRAYTEGYMSEAGCVLTDAEVKSLATGAAVITLELASRFLGDYLVGDKYFRIAYPEQNLQRARAQLTLFTDMMKHMDEMQAIVRDCAGRE
ncbi:MAG: aminoglycoside phosphotransferase family protein [Oscillospiraceae bacterium]|nr:aminoglycoside phosphotransferase family protein [Oscillospiraceae bacterium]